MRSLFTQLCLGHPRSHIVVIGKPKLQSVPSRSCKSLWNLEVYTRVPRLESNYVSIYKLQPSYFVTGNFWRNLHCEEWKLCRAHSCEVPPKQSKTKADRLEIVTPITSHAIQLIPPQLTWSPDTNTTTTHPITSKWDFSTNQTYCNTARVHWIQCNSPRCRAALSGFVNIFIPPSSWYCHVYYLYASIWGALHYKQTKKKPLIC